MLTRVELNWLPYHVLLTAQPTAQLWHDFHPPTLDTEIFLMLHKNAYDADNKKVGENVAREKNRLVLHTNAILQVPRLVVLSQCIIK